MDELEKTAQILNRGGLVIFPTETVYGIGCLVSFPESVKRLYRIKSRENQPTLVLIKDLPQAKEYVEFVKEAEILAAKFWPGPLTLCLPMKKPVPAEILASDQTLGVRLPGFDWTEKLLQKLAAPLLAPSANFKGELPAKKFTEIDKKLSHLVDYVVKVEPTGQEVSTIVSFAKKPYNLIREGALKNQDLKVALQIN